MVCAELVGLVAAHEEADFVGFFVFEEADVAGAAFFPFAGGFVETEELGAPKKMVKCGLARTPV